MTDHDARERREEAIRHVVGICNRIPGATTWNAAEFMYDHLASLPAPAPAAKCGDEGQSLCPACSLPAHELTQVPGCGAPMPRPPFAITAEQLGEIMQEEWSEICEDAQAHPQDIRHEGRKLFYDPRHWTAAIADRLNARLPSPTPAAGEAVAWFKADQLANLEDPFSGGEAGSPGVNIAARKTRGGNFTMPLYAAPQPPEQCANIAQKSEQAPAPGGEGDGAEWRTVLNLSREHGKTRDDMRTAFSLIGSIAEKHISRTALANHSPDDGGVGEAWVCDGIPDEVIEAGISAWDAAKHDMENYVSGVTTDWDEGMIVAAIYKAMSAGLCPADAEGGE